jgi:manganese/iron transport system substrate-binding protein
VLTTFTVLADLAREVAGERADIASITRPGAEIHDYEPTPQDIARAQGADLVLWNGMGLERWFERFFRGLEGAQQAVLSEGVVPIPIAEGAYAGQPNPHAWMSPGNAVIYVDNIRKALTRIDPAGAAYYAERAASYQARLRALDGPIRERLARLPEGQRLLVSCENAFPYLARDYGLQNLHLWPINSDAEGTPQQVRQMIDQVRRNRIPVVFCETTVSDRAMRQVARETRARFGGSLFVDSLSPPGGPAPTFMSMLDYNVTLILRGFEVP